MAIIKLLDIDMGYLYEQIFEQKDTKLLFSVWLSRWHLEFPICFCIQSFVKTDVVDSS